MTYLRSSIIALLLMGALFIGAYDTKQDSPEKEIVILNSVLGYLNQFHFSPVAIDDHFSEEAFDYYLSMIDNGRRFLTKDDVSKLEAYKYLIDDQVKALSLDFFELSLELLNNGIAKSKAYYNEIIAKPVELNSSESIELDHDKRDFPENDEQLKKNWKKILNYEVITRVEREQRRKLEKNEEVDLKELEKKGREDVKELFDDWFKRIDQLRRSDRFEIYVNTFTHVYDPHSDYFTPKGKQDFDIGMGGKLEGIGARLTSEGDYTKIASIVPGGPAWKGKELEVDDLIIAVTQEGEEPVDIFGMRTDDVVQLIRGKKETVVFLTVRKKDKTEQDIRIVRDIVIIDDSFARSVILDIPGVIDNVGYIKLPKFYSSFEGKDGNSSATDVAIEIQKLKEKNVNGIILDLRFNGGGSLKDVVDMSGLFIEEGPIVQVKPRDRKAYVYNDEDASVHWEGPLIVMVNSYSASASEILAAAVQDYKRAIIVGSNSTYGKGTVQRFYDLDRGVRGADEFKPLGEIKLTMQKYYRVNGGSVQLRGVVPDIILPDRYSYVGVGESEYEHAMAWSEINRVPYSQDVMVLGELDLLKSKSHDRISNNERFNLILESAEQLKENREMTLLPLDLGKLGDLMTEREEDSKKYENMFSEPVPNLQVSNLEADLAYLDMDDSRKARNDDLKDQINKDIYIEETLYILKDLLDNKSYVFQKSDSN